MLIKNARLSFPSIFKPSAFEAGQTEKYSGTFILDPGHPQTTAIAEEMSRVAVEKWGDATGKLPNGLVEILKQKPCVRKNETKVNKSGDPMSGFEPGGVFFNASNSLKPTAIDQYGNEITEASGKIYAGCRVNVVVDFWAQDNKFGRRINASLGGIQFHADDEAFGGGRPASVSEFELADASEALAEATESVAPAVAAQQQIEKKPVSDMFL